MAALIGLAVLSTPALAKKNPSMRTDQIRGVALPPKDVKHQPIHDALSERRVLELLRELLSPLRLPRRLTLQVKSCDGTIDASYENDIATVCYEYIEYIQQNAPKLGTPGGLTPADAITAATLDTFLHEVGHAVFDMLDVPVLGREEDAADYFSAYILLQFAPEDAHRLIQGVGFLLATEAKTALEKTPKATTFADEHGTPAQRYYNLLCMAYGSDPKTFANAVLSGRLPKQRAEGCAEEYKMLQRAFRKLILPHFDQALFKSAHSKVRFKWDEMILPDAERDAPPPLE
ncbi:MAG: hypothetical protein HY848_20830 [Betaproteobacteria bacterium]|nr:hypothetical protein [Betaproteobacteria bacterium]